MSNRKSTKTKGEQRAIRAQQLIFVAIGLIVILSMVLSLVVK
jgi:hypothetical protein